MKPTNILADLLASLACLPAAAATPKPIVLFIVNDLNAWVGRFDRPSRTLKKPGGISGAELAQQLRHRKADLRATHSSGYSIEIGGKSLNENDAMFLAKPYRPPQLAQRIRKCLDNPPLPILELATA